MTGVAVEFVSPPILREMSERVGGSQREPLQATVAAFRGLIREEFDREFWRPPSGPPRPWERTKAFGNRPPPAKTLHRRGALRRAWLGRGAGAIEVYGQRSVTVGVAGSIIPYAAVHRGGPGRVRAADARRPFRIRVTRRMRGYLAAALGVYLRRTTTHIEIPRRPHASINPELTTRINAIWSAWAVGRRAPAGAAA